MHCSWGCGSSTRTAFNRVTHRIMADPLLSSLCTICHISPPKYTCPKCSVQTCSFPCVRRHKLWSSCSGVRDPTVYKTKEELQTPAGVDHDYNFLHSIEHRVQRAEREVVEEKGIISYKELEEARNGKVTDNLRGLRHRGPPRQAPGEECIKTMLKMMGTRLHRAPKGMQRNLDNGTNWSKKNRSINWQIEWMRNGGKKRQLGNMLSNKSIAYHYDNWVEGDKRARMTDDEVKSLKKRKAAEVKERSAKRTKIDGASTMEWCTSSRLQNPKTGAWNVVPQQGSPTNVTLPFAPDTYVRVNEHSLYLLRPLTSKKFPKVLSPIHVDLPLSEVLRRRDVVEFPTIYVFEEPIDALPDEFMLEKDYLVATGQIVESSDGDSESSESNSEEDSDEQDSDSALEDGEVGE